MKIRNMLVDGAAGGLDVTGERLEAVLHRRHVDPFGLQQGDHLGPVGAVGEGAVHENDRRKVGCEGECDGGNQKGKVVLVPAREASSRTSPSHRPGFRP